MRLRTALRILLLSAAIAAPTAAAPEENTVPDKAAKKPAAKEPVAKTVTRPNAPPKAVPKPGAPKTAPKKNASRPASQIAAIRQQHPTPERYKEIQQALADKGYFSGSADGNWGQDSVDALKRFQHDQNLTEDGKIGSLSLIALGLGPKHDASPVGSSPVPDRPPEKTDP